MNSVRRLKRTNLETLELLTDLFSFFNFLDSSLSRQVCKWWDGLLTKDLIILKQIDKNRTKDDRFVEGNPGVLAEACQTGYIEIVKFSLGCGCWFSPWFFKYVVKSGSINLLKWIKGNVQSYDDVTSYPYAAANGNLKVLKWIRKNKAVRWVWEGCTTSWAAEKGHLHILKYLRSEDIHGKDVCPWDEDTCVFAAENGHLDVLRWAFDNGCEWSSEVCNRSREQPHIQAYIHGLPEDESPCYCDII